MVQRTDTRPIWLRELVVTTLCFGFLLKPWLAAEAAGPLPEFTFQKVALHPKDLSYAPTGDLVHPTIIKTKGRVSNPLGKYYLYYAPHKHVSISMAYSDSIEGPWTEYKQNPVNKYIMLYSGFIEGREIRCIWLAHSKDAENWVQLKTPLVEPIEGEMKDCYGPALLRWKGRNFVTYQDHTTWRGGNLKYVELDQEFNPVGAGGARYVLLEPPDEPPLNNRYRGAEFYLEGDTL